MNILLCVTGLSPQVVTESLYALSVQRKHTFVPDEIHVITTTLGKKCLQKQLYGCKEGMFHQLCADFTLPLIRFNDATVTLIRDTNHEPLNDIRTLEHNECAANIIVATIRKLTEDEDNTLHVSIAGGRKTMGFFAGYALSLFGRQQDELSHVLVEPDFEANPDFYYPTPKSKYLYTKNNRKVDASKAKIDLALIPFVPLRKGLNKVISNINLTYSEAVEELNNVFLEPEVTVDFKTAEIICGTTPIAFEPRLKAIYLTLLHDKLENNNGIHWNCTESLIKILNEYGRLSPLNQKPVKNLNRLIKNKDESVEKQEDLIAWLTQSISKINTALKKQLGATCIHYRVESEKPNRKIGSNSHSVYVLRNLESTQLHSK